MTRYSVFSLIKQGLIRQTGWDRAWRDSQVRDYDEAVRLELKKLDFLAREAWAGWHRSQQPAETTRVTQGDGGKKAEKTVRQQTCQSG